MAGHCSRRIALARPLSCAPMLKRLASSRYAFPAAILAVAAIAGVVVLIASSGGDDGGGSGKEVPAPQPKNVEKGKRPTLELDKTKTYTATIDTNCGQFVIELDAKRA